MLNRRDFLLSTGAAGLALGVGLEPGQGWAASPLSVLFDGYAEELLQESPQGATALGLDKGPHAALKSKLDDASWAAVEAANARSAARLKELKAIDRASLKGADATNYDAVVYANELGAAAAKFQYGDNTLITAMGEAATPYVVSQQTGAFSGVPEFLNSQHKIDEAADADAYLTRVEAMAAQLDQQTERVKKDAGLGVIPPDFILATTLTQMKGYRATPAAETGLVASLAKRAAAKGLSADYATRCAKLVEDKVFPALDRQIAALDANAAKAGHDAGVWRLPDGEAYYAWCLKVGTSTPLTPHEVHLMGIEQNKAIEARMDALLRAQGLNQGTVGQRMAALGKDPKNLYPNTDDGRAQLLDYLSGRIAAVRPLMPKLSRMHLRADVVVKRVPVDIELGQGLGYMNPGALDGSRPSTYYINLHDTANWPRFSLPSLTYHETIPGHVWQGAFVTERHTLPLINTMLGFNAYVEGWALYAEQLADEVGLYDDDPLGRLGYLQGQKFRACRLVVDTGLHAERWTREQAVEWMVGATGRSKAAITSEVDRYCSGPGQACGYKVGHTEIVRLREKAKKAMGARFDLRDFNDVVVTAGTVPLTVLARVIDDYIAG
ncbi:DUF885 domain-containing protein [Phenylobacterium montanum]|uniref:DUF885 family protein n=1 Tax=Phenylobacterium montanum TaxID=2823693 RepID=A0A975FXI9_9CAUL|nr:DUF885 family protein [Caulobacter sp. S6]QUD87064.1 DUF885 family protein [Caulobacter sp. S6]